MRRLLPLAVALLALGGASARALPLPGARVPGLSGEQRVEPARRLAAGRGELGAADRVDRALHRAASGLRLRPLGRRQPIGIPFDVVSKTTPRSRVTFDYADESDKGPYPIPKTVHIEGGARVERRPARDPRSTRRLQALRAVRALSEEGRRLEGRLGRDLEPALERAAPGRLDVRGRGGLPIFPGLARYDEVARGVDRPRAAVHGRTHAAAYVYPARHYASDSTDPSLPPMGLRVRLKANVDISGFPRQARIVLQALKTYGMILADNGSNWYISGAPNPHWSNDDLHTLGRITGSDFEVVDTSSLPHPGG